VAAMSRGSEILAETRAFGGIAARVRDTAPPRPAKASAGPSAAAAPSDTESPSETANTAEEEPSSPGEADGHLRLVEEITSDVEKDDLRSHYDLGMAYLEMGLFTEAIKDFQIASRCEDLQLSSMEMIGYCFLKNNQARLAVKQLMRALDVANVSGAEKLGIHYNLGMAHEMLGELDSAREHFEEGYIVDMSFRDVSEKMKKLSTIS